VVAKVSKSGQDIRFDVLVIGMKTIQVTRAADASVLAADVGKTLLYERDRLQEAANAAGE
jgi:DUF1009 family protein